MNKLIKPHLKKHLDKITENKDFQLLIQKHNIKNVSNFKKSSLLLEVDLSKFKDIDDFYKYQDKYLIKYSFEDMADNEYVKQNIIPIRLPDYTESMFEEIFTLPKSFTYENNITLDQEEIKKALFKRIYPSKLTKLILKNFFGGYQYPTDEDIISNQKYVSDFIYAMAKHKAYENCIDEEDMFEDLEDVDKDFIDYYISSKDITKQQRSCEHDTNDTFSDDGHWYNCIGTCNKCLLIDENNPIEDDENFYDLNAAWIAAKELYKKD